MISAITFVVMLFTTFGRPMNARLFFTGLALFDAAAVSWAYRQIHSPACLIAAVLFLLVAAGCWWWFGR